MKHKLTFLLAVLMCCSLLLAALAPAMAAEEWTQKANAGGEPTPEELAQLNESATAAKTAYENAVRTALAAGLEIDADGLAYLPEELDDHADLIQLGALIGAIKASKAAWDAAIKQAEALGVEIVYIEDYEPAQARPDEESDPDELEMAEQARIKAEAAMAAAKAAAEQQGIEIDWDAIMNARAIAAGEPDLEDPNVIEALAKAEAALAAAKKAAEEQGIEIDWDAILKLPALPAEQPCEHDYADVVTAPTCTEGGYTTYTCSKCGDSYQGDETEAQGHDFQDGVCTRCGAWDDLPTVISVDLQEQMKIMADDARVMVAIDLKGLDQDYVLSEIAREMGVDLETLKRENSSGDTLDYVLAKRAVLKRLYGEYNGAFLAEYLPDLPTECRRYVAKTHAALVLSLTKAEILRLAQEEQVIAMGYISPEEMDAVAANDTASLVVPFLFDDVKNDSQFYYVPVYWAVDQKITKGTSEKLFSPGESCTRAQVVTFLWRAAGEPEPAETVNPFQDVKADAYYCKAVLWAVEKGITKGTSAGAFSPEATCTRAQIVTFLYRADGTPEVFRKGKPFTDVDAAQYYADAVAWAVENGITTGKSPETFAPNATCTRAEVVTFLYRAGNK